MPPVLVMVLLGWVAARAARPIDDPDDWWHLRLGNDLIDQHSLAAPAHWSAFATVSWVPTEPLPEGMLMPCAAIHCRSSGSVRRTTVQRIHLPVRPFT